jgi:hypothetical protein
MLGSHSYSHKLINFKECVPTSVYKTPFIICQQTTPNQTKFGCLQKCNISLQFCSYTKCIYTKARIMENGTGLNDKVFQVEMFQKYLKNHSHLQQLDILNIL